MMLRRFALLCSCSLVVCFGFAQALDAQSAPATADALQLEQVILVSRHGVRSPTATRPPLAQIAADPWPTWNVGPGELTPHGQQVATLMGAYYRSAFADAGLLAPNGCPRANDLFVWSDVEQRTRLTAQALIDGMYPGCGLKPTTQKDMEADDPLFHPTTAGVCKVDGPTARAAVLGRIGGGGIGDTTGGNADFTPLLKAYAQQFARMQSVLKCCAPALCAPGSKSCTLAQVPATINAEGRLQGPIPIASTATEIFLLEYENNLPADQVGWGRIDEPTLRYLMQLHQLQFNLGERTLYPAQRYGSNLLDQVLNTLRAKVSGKTAPRAKAPAASKAVLYVAHDTNIANLGGMLNVDWLLEGYQANETPPDGAIAFELFRRKGNGKTAPQYFVRLFYYAQSPTQLREAVKLDATHPPSRAEIALPGCAVAAAAAGSGMACPWPVFERIAASVIDRECVGSGSTAPKKRIESMR